MLKFQVQSKANTNLKFYTDFKVKPNAEAIYTKEI